MKSKSGFTIVELLVVIIIIAILASISVVAYRGIQGRADFTTMISAVDSYEKILRMIKIRDGAYPSTAVYDSTIPGYTYPNTKLSTSYACLAPEGSLPATSDFPQDSCFEQSANGGASTTLGSPFNSNIIQKLQQETPSLPRVPQIATTYSGSTITQKFRGIMYYSITSSGYTTILYTYDGFYGCPRGTKSEFGTAEQPATMCSVTLN